MAAPSGSSGWGSRRLKPVEAEEMRSESADVIPGFPDADSFVKYALGTIVNATKVSGGLPQSGDEYDFYRSFPGFREYCETQGDRLLHCMSRMMQYHGCRSQIKDPNKVTEIEDKFDMLVDANDVILERVSNLLDEATGVHKVQQPILPSGLQAPKTIVSSWNRKAGDTTKKTKSETFRLLHAKNISRPQIKFKEKVDNSNTPFMPLIFVKPNALKPLPQALADRRNRSAEDQDVPAALADFIHQQRTQRAEEEDIFAHPYQYELDHFSPDDSVLRKPKPQMYKPLKETKCHLVTTLDELVELNEKLSKCKEFAVDLEHHSYRSFLGLTCLMQISTREEDFIIDTLELRSVLYILNETFTDPTITKVLHGADSDVEWLQRDCGLYLVGMFDTHQAARLLNLGRHSLDHCLKHYCGTESDKKYQLADWRIRPLPEEMIQYAREDTHYLLYIYDKMRVELLEKGNEQPNLLLMVWQKSKELCLKRYMKPIFTEMSYLELYRKQKRQFNEQQLTTFKLLYSWRDRVARLEDESTGYVLPNHMMLKIAEELPKEPQGIIACCNPVPPMVRQQVNELHLLVQQGREIPLHKPETQGSEKKKGPVFKPEKREVPLFGPHDTSHLPLSDVQTLPRAAPVLQKSRLFPDEDVKTAGKRTSDINSLIASAVVTIFSESDDAPKKGKDITVAQQKARNIMQSFDNPFRMFLPSKDNNIHFSERAKFDPSSKVYEISNRWKLLSIEQQEKEAKEKEDAKKAKEAAKKASEARIKMQEDYKAAAQEVLSVRQQAALAATMQVSTKRERWQSEPGEEIPKPEKKKRPKPPQQSEEQQSTKPFTPFDYSQSDFQVFAGDSRSRHSDQFDPNKQAQGAHHSKKMTSGKKVHPHTGNKSMSYLAGKSDRGFKHSWPKR